MPTRIPVSLAALYAARAALDTAILAVEQESGVGEPGVEPGSCPRCQADAEQQEVRDTMDGTRRRWCKVCHHEWEPM